MHNFKSNLKRLSLVGAAALLLQMCVPFLVQQASAAQLNGTMLRLNRIKTGSVDPGGTICIKSANTTSLTSLNIIFPAGFTLTGVAANWAANNSSTNAAWPAGAIGFTSVTSTPSAVVNGSRSVTWTIATATPAISQWYCMNFTSNTTALTLPAAGSSQLGTITTNGTDTGNYDTEVVANDQITINNTTVPAIFNMTFGANADGFAGNSIASPLTRTDSTGVGITVATNAPNGYMLWAKDANSSGGKGSLASTLASYKISTASAVGSASHTYASGTNNGEDYGLGVTISGIGTADPAYDGSANKLGVYDPTNLQTIVAAAGPTTAATTVTLTTKAATGNATPAATDYSDVITVVGAGLF